MLLMPSIVAARWNNGHEVRPTLMVSLGSLFAVEKPEAVIDADKPITVSFDPAELVDF